MIKCLLLYRMCDGKNVCSSNNRDFNVSKNSLIKKCLNSLKENIENLSNDIEFNFTAVIDNCSDDIINYLKTVYNNITLINNAETPGNAGSFCRCVNIAKERANDEIIFFLEDDYLFLTKTALNDSIHDLNDITVMKGRYCAYMPYDDPLHYKNNIKNTECIMTSRSHHLLMDQTTCTFMMYGLSVKINYNNLIKFKNWPHIGEEGSVNLCWRNTNLYQTIPSRILHIQTKNLIPPYIKYDEIKAMIENNTYEKLLTLYKHPFTLIRLGKKSDGGYVVPKELINNNLISCGISNEVSFEEAYLKKITSPNIHCFDGTINSFPSKEIAFNWHKMNIGATDTDTDISLNTIFDKCFKDKNEVFIKMDIEHAEYPAFNTISDANLSKIQCLVLEVHSIKSRYNDFCTLMSILNRHLVLIHKHDNNNGTYFIENNVKYANVYELTFINKKYISNFEINDIKLPIEGLDFNNR